MTGLRSGILRSATPVQTCSTYYSIILLYNKIIRIILLYYCALD